MKRFTARRRDRFALAVSNKATPSKSSDPRRQLESTQVGPSGVELSLTRDRSAINAKYKFGFIGDAENAVVPVLQYRNGTYRLIGTASYFGEPDWFITAAHIFEGDDINASDGFAVFFQGAPEPTRLSEKYSFADIDLAICRLEEHAQAYIGGTKPLAVMNLPPEVGEVVAAFGYSHSNVDPENTFEDQEGGLIQALRIRSKWELGGVLAVHPEGRGWVSGECYETSVLVEGRDSGGPLFNSNGFLIGVVSSSFKFENGLPNSTFTSIIRIGEYEIAGTPINEIWFKGQRAAVCKRLHS